MNKTRVIKKAFVATVLVVLATYLINIIPFSLRVGKTLADLDIYDIYYSNRSSENLVADKEIVLIQIGDDRSEIAEQLRTIRKYEPKLIALDATFEEPRDSEMDQQLAEEAAKTPNLVYAFGFDRNSVTVPNIFYDEASNASAGYVDLSSDTDVVVRTYSPFVTIGEKQYEAFTSSILRKADVERYQSLKNRNYDKEVINYTGNLNNFLTITSDELKTLDSLQLQTLVKNKLVLLGYFIKNAPPVLSDLFYTPLNKKLFDKRTPDMYGVVIHANILSMILKENFATFASDTTVYLCAFVVLFLLNLFFFSGFTTTYTPGYLRFLAIQFSTILLIIPLFLLVYESSLFKIRLQPILLAIVLNSIVAFLYYRHKKTSAEKHILETEVAHRTAQLKQSLEELRSTQAQLIQKEKMASLGELTAGVAHEIQNPLNFINNFSDVNTELIDELKEEVKAGNSEEALAIAEDIKQNGMKVNLHGKRADAIVKSMLQHSRTSGGEKEPTDINSLADEYLRLAYHGFKAKNKDFKVNLKTEFDDRINKVLVVQQDIGRVLLNLYNNAFYSLADKQAKHSAGFEPTVWVTTKKKEDKVEIRVKDNGKGINQNIVSKIFQPFFTTKPTGEGTGLGLSLSYDIIKSTGGELKVETKEGEYAEFIILLPV